MTLYCGTHHWLWVQKILNHGLNHGFFLSLFKLIFFPIHLIVCVISYLNFRAVLVPPKTAGSAQTHKSISFNWIVWSTLNVYLCLKAKMSTVGKLHSGQIRHCVHQNVNGNALKQQRICFPVKKDKWQHIYVSFLTMYNK